jgi:hypothetical protein
VVLEGGYTEEQVHHAIRIAATVQAAAVSLEIGALWGGQQQPLSPAFEALGEREGVSPSSRTP